jgi:ABC-2 type transport system permease protein
MWLVILAVGTGTRIANAYGYSLEDMSRFTRYFVLSSSVESGNAMTFLFALFSAMCAFSFMYSPRSANAMAALPVRRERMFTVQALAGLVPLIVANVLVALATYGVEAYHGVADAAPLAQWVAIVTMQLILYYGLAILCAQLTGNIIVLPILYVVLNFTVFVVELVTRRALEFFVYGVPAGSNTLTVFSPVVYLWENVTVNLPSGTDTVDYAHSTFSGWGVLAIYCVVGVIFAVCALLLFRKKRVETAGDVVAVKALKPCYRRCAVLAAAPEYVFRRQCLDAACADAGRRIRVLFRSGNADKKELPRLEKEGVHRFWRVRGHLHRGDARRGVQPVRLRDLCAGRKQHRIRRHEHRRGIYEALRERKYLRCRPAA